jgi:hypothetical protein
VSRRVRKVERLSGVEPPGIEALKQPPRLAEQVRVQVFAQGGGQERAATAEVTVDDGGDQPFDVVDVLERPR